MGKASSSKKVARAAGTGGGRTNRSSTPWTFVGLLALIVVVGVALTFTSRNRAQNEKNALTTSNASVAPTIGGTPWNEGFAVDICGRFQPPIKVASDVEGLTTDGNGVIHIAPKIKSAAGRNATLGELAKSLGITVSASQIKLRGSKTYVNGEDCSGRPAKVYIKQYPYVGATGTLLTDDPGTVPLVDQSLLTVAFVPSADKSKIPAPPSYVTANLKEVSTASTTTLPTTTTLPSTATTTGSATPTTTGSATATTTGSATPTTTAGKSTATTSASKGTPSTTAGSTTASSS